MANELKKELWKDYIEKGNSFANWFTSILISNFVYLIKVGQDGRLNDFGKGSLGFSLASLVFMFLFKGLGVLTAKKRCELASEGKETDNTSIKSIEDFRTGLFYSFVVLGIIAVLLSGIVLWSDLTSPRLPGF